MQWQSMQNAGGGSGAAPHHHPWELYSQPQQRWPNPGLRYFDDPAASYGALPAPLGDEGFSAPRQGFRVAQASRQGFAGQLQGSSALPVAQGRVDLGGGGAQQPSEAAPTRQGKPVRFQMTKGGLLVTDAAPQLHPKPSFELTESGLLVTEPLPSPPARQDFELTPGELLVAKHAGNPTPPLPPPPPRALAPPHTR